MPVSKQSGSGRMPLRELQAYGAAAAQLMGVSGICPSKLTATGARLLVSRYLNRPLEDLPGSIRQKGHSLSFHLGTEA